MREIISLIILSAAMYEFASDQSTADRLQSAAVQQDIRIESVKAHEAMFRESCKVTVVNPPHNYNINGRTGSLLYFDDERKQFAVNLETKRGDGRNRRVSVHIFRLANSGKQPSPEEVLGRVSVHIFTLANSGKQPSPEEVLVEQVRVILLATARYPPRNSSLE